MSKSKSPQYIFVKHKVPGASQSLFSPFFLSVGVELDLKNLESGPIFRQWLSVPGCPVSESQSLSRCLDAAPLTSPSSWPPIGPK